MATGKLQRLSQLHRILQANRRPMSILKLSQELGCSASSIRRDIDELKAQGAPIDYSHKDRGYHYNPEEKNHFQPTGLWLSTNELQSLIIILNILKTMESTFLGEGLLDVEKNLQKLLIEKGIDPALFNQTIKYLPSRKRTVENPIFNTTSQALLAQQRLTIIYSDYQGKKTQREVSPVHLVCYQENWYLDAWCHLREDLRSFLLTRIDTATQLDTEVQVIQQELVNAHFESSYGIFAGMARYTAKLRFFGNSAREVADQQWHPEQIGQWDGRDYLLSIPYNDDRELIRDVLKFGNNVEVIAPARLRNGIKRICQSVVLMYS